MRESDPATANAPAAADLKEAAEAALQHALAAADETERRKLSIRAGILMDRYYRGDAPYCSPELIRY